MKTFLPKRLQFEADKINNFLEANGELNSAYLKVVDTQIPLATNNWLNFDFVEVVQDLFNVFTKKDVVTLKSCLKKPQGLGQLESCLAAFCILHG